MDPKPTILLVTGAFTDGSCYDYLLPNLQIAGYQTVIAALPSARTAANHSSFDPIQHSAASDGAYVLDQFLRPLINEGKDVVIFAHSFGATCLSGAGEGLDKKSRAARGEEGGVLQLVYMSFALVPDEKDQIGVLGSAWPPFCQVDKPEQGLLTFAPVNEVLYNDITDQALRQKLADSHLPSSIHIFTTPVVRPLWADPGLESSRMYLRPLDDHTFPPAFQDQMIEDCGLGWKVREVKGGHCAFVAHAEEVARAIVQAVEG